jgi:hypothetical protein
MPGATKALTGWGVEVKWMVRRGRGRKTSWVKIVRPGTDTPLCTSLQGAQAWVTDYERRGLVARLVEVDAPRGRSHRDPPAAKPLSGQLDLFGRPHWLSACGTDRSP